MFKMFTISFLREDWLPETTSLAELKQLDYVASKPESGSKSELVSSPLWP